MSSETSVIVTARNEADRIGATLTALAFAFPGAAVFVADDGSTDATPEIARRAGALLVRSELPMGKGAAATRAARDALERVEASGGEAGGGASVFVLCDGDLGQSASRLQPLVEAVRSGRADMAVAAFSSRAGGGLGLAVASARWAIRRSCGFGARAPISGQRALSGRALAQVLPFAHGFGMEVGITIDAIRAGHDVIEMELDLDHRATGRTPAGFSHRARQLVDILRAYAARRYAAGR
jgi:glycosyltransferase involved in cell wall biosynthesis